MSDLDSAMARHWEARARLIAAQADAPAVPPTTPAAVSIAARPRPCEVLFVGPGVWPVGGTESWHLALLPRLRALGLDVGGYAVGAVHPGPALEAFRRERVPVLVGADSVREAARLAQLVVVWGDPPADWVPPGPRVIAVAHNDAASDWTRRAMASWSARADRFAAVSAEAAAALPADRQAAAVAIPSAVDPDRLKPTRERIATRSALGWDRPTLLSLGRLSPEKRPQIALEALAKLPGWILAVAGSGSIQADLEALASRLGIADRVRFLGPRNDVGDLLHAADAVIVPSDSEGFSLAAAEALWVGAPLVAHPVGCLTDGNHATIVPFGADAQDWADAVLRAVDPDRLADRDRDRDWARAEFDPDRWADRWADLIAETLGRPRSRTRRRLRKPRPIGDQVHAVLARLGFRERPGCSCQSLQNRMNALGAAGCRRESAQLAASMVADLPRLLRFPGRITARALILAMAAIESSRDRG